MKLILLAIFFALGVMAQSPNDLKLAPDSPAISAGANLGPPYQMILDPSAINTPYDLYDQSVAGWVIGAFGAVPGFTISGASISGVTTTPQ